MSDNNQDPNSRSAAAIAIEDYMDVLLASVPEQRQAILGPKEQLEKERELFHLEAEQIKKEAKRLKAKKRAALKAQQDENPIKEAEVEELLVEPQPSDSDAKRKSLETDLENIAKTFGDPAGQDDEEDQSSFSEFAITPRDQGQSSKAPATAHYRAKSVTPMSLLDEPSLSRHITASPVIKSALPTVLPATLESETGTQNAAERTEGRDVSHLVQKVDGEALKQSEPLESKPVDEAQIGSQEAPEASQEVVADYEEENIGAPPEWHDNGRPGWAQDRFECLLFSVAGLKLAVPLVSLGSIHRLDEELTPIVGRATWFMGLFPTGERNIKVVDTARWVMPDRVGSQTRENYQFVIRLGGCNWGMACDTVAEAIQLEPKQVRWRTERSKRPWLSGTVIDQMCALLDADALGYLLEKDIA